MLRTTLITATALVLSMASAYAGGNTCIGNANCSTTNNDNDTYNTTNEGGKGGTGVGVGVGIGVAGAAASSSANNANSVRNDVDIRNTNTSVNTNVNSQYQGQGQLQGQKQRQSAVSNSNSSVDDSGNSSVNIEGDQYRRQTPMAYAPTASGGDETCRFSNTVGGSSPVFGFSLGLNTDDDGCERRRDANALYALGLKSAATELMCLDDNVRTAMRNAGTPCAADRITVPVAEQPVASLPEFVPMQPIANE